MSSLLNRLRRPLVYSAIPPLLAWTITAAGAAPRALSGPDDSTRLTRRDDGSAGAPATTPTEAPAKARTPPAPPLADATSDREWTVVRDLWYTLELAGRDCGWMNSRVEEAGDRYRTITSMQLQVGRAGATVEIGTNSTFVETKDGEPVRLEVVQLMGQTPTVQEYEFAGNEVTVTTRQGGAQRRSRQVLESTDWLTPMEVERYTKERRAAGAKTIEYRTIDGQQGIQVIQVTETCQGDDTVNVQGREIPVTIWHTVTSNLPTGATTRVDKDGVLVASSVKLGGLDLATRLASREAALDVRVGELPEVMVATFVRPDRPIRDVMNKRTLTLRVRAKEGALPALPSTGAQRVQPVKSGAAGEAGGAVELVIDLDKPLQASEAEVNDAAYLEASAMVDIDDPYVRAMAEGAVQKAANGTTVEKAEQLRGYVNRYIRDKGLSTAFATASEVARRRNGDCSEHAVLLCALLRANGIPARVATGLVYADEFAGREGIFGWHMWTQALIDGRWIDLDPTLPVPYHAGHVLVATSPLSGTAFDESLISTATLIGNLEIDVIDDRGAKN